MLLWQLLRGDLSRPKELLVLIADPGMEHSGSYAHRDHMMNLCADAGIEAQIAPGPNLYHDLIELPRTPRSRIDHPPYWVKKEDGTAGRLRQACTYYYKIAPMDRVIRKVLEEKFAISQTTKHLKAGIVEKWLGFSADEQARCKPPRQHYVTFRYPLIEQGITTERCVEWMQSHGLAVPPRSVCNACFANGLTCFKEMYQDRPDDWLQAVAVDEAIRDLSAQGIQYPVFVNKTLEPLASLPGSYFNHEEPIPDQDHWSCDSGYCFV